MSLIHLPKQMHKILRSALKVGVLKERARTEKGTPQRGIISPSLCNIALSGIEDIWNQPAKYFSNTYNRIIVKKSAIVQWGIRYADNLIFFLEDQEDAVELRRKIDAFLAKRGLNVKEAKTHLVLFTEGFDFLGWQFEVKANHALTSWPSKKNRRNLKDNIKTVMRDCRFKLNKRLSKVKVIYRGWWNYH